MGYSSIETLAKPAFQSAARTAGSHYAKKAMRYLATGSNKRSYERTANKRKSRRQDSRLAIAKRATFDFLPSLRQGNTLVLMNLGAIDQGDAINDRERQVIFVSGVKINFFARNNISKPLFCNWALIQMKHTAAAPTITDVGAEMFRGTGTTRAVNFGSISDAYHKHTYTLNSEKYDVHMQGRFTLNPYAAEDFGASDDVWKSVEHYVPIGRKLYYDGLLSTDCTNPLLFITWCNAWDVQTAAAATDQWDTRFHSVVYFKECI